MSIIFLVLPLALVIVVAGVLAFVWAARRGQYDDLETPAVRMLHDDVPVGSPLGATGSVPAANRPATPDAARSLNKPPPDHRDA